MNDIDFEAQHFHSDGDRLISDYFVALLPCQILYLDALVIEKRQLPTPTEFIFKAIRAGLSTAEEISSFLGLNKAYTEKLLENFKIENYVGVDEFAKLKLLRKAIEALASGGERRPLDKTIPILWDSVLSKPIQQRPELYNKKQAANVGQIWMLPNASHIPEVSSLNVAELENYFVAGQDLSSGRESNEILRVVSVKRALFRYRPISVLVYEKEGSPPIFKVVVNGKIEDKLSNEIAQKDGAKFIGIDGSFSRKAGALAVKERHKQLLVIQRTEKSSPVDVDGLIRRRSALMFSINTLKVRIAEEPSESLQARLIERESVYSDIESSLKEVEVVPLLPFDIPVVLAEALSGTARILIITTTVPHQNHFTASIQQLMEQALGRGMQIKIYIAGRPTDQQTEKTEAKSALARINQLAEKYSNLQASFLKIHQRQVFEICVDRSKLVFCNEPPLGMRPGGFMPRSFRGFQVSGEKQIAAYIQQHLSISDEDILQRIRSHRSDTQKNNAKK